jgi:iron complex outermembrane receptor protein
VIWAQYASNGDNERNWYYNTGRKTDFNIFSKVTYTPVKVLSIFADLQYRRVLYRMEGTLDDQRELDQNHTFDFFNPKCGVLANFNNRHEWFLYFGIANREPSRNNYKDADPDRLPSAERLYDYELGYSLKYPDFSIRANLFYMNYRNQLVLTGEINNVGEAVMVNVPHSYRTGIELSAGAGFFRKKLNWNVSATFSSSKIKDFTTYTDTYDASGEFTGQRSEYLGTTDLSFSPSILVLSDISITPVRDLTFSLLSRYAGRQYIDNTGDPERSLHDYFVNSLTASYALRDLGVLREISFNLAVNNLFSVKYETNAWVYPYYYDNEYYEANGYFPQALIHFLFGISLKI